MSKALIVAFSRADENYNVGITEVGNTEKMANVIQQETGADYFKIVPEVPYPKDYSSCVEKATEEKTEDARPAYQGDVENWADYDTVYLGYPIWWSDLPMITYTFIENHDWQGKTVIPFCTHEGSGNSGTFMSLKDAIENAKEVKPGLALVGHEIDDKTAEIKDWLKAA